MLSSMFSIKNIYILSSLLVLQWFWPNHHDTALPFKGRSKGQNTRMDRCFVFSLNFLPPKNAEWGRGLSVVAFCAHTLLLLWVRDNHNCVVRWHKLCQQRGHALNCVSSKSLMGALPSHLSGQMCNCVLVRSKGRHQAVAEIPNM